MSNIVISVEKLSKLYRLGERLPYRTLCDTINNAFVSLLHNFKNGLNPRKNARGYVWALKDVSFEVKGGEVVGVIGPNGAGKSTLLKIFSRITPPTSGYAEIQGRVASLLEVGTGFHPELTGRDNIYLNGAILGMKKAEIKRKFDEIVSFAEVEKFIDTPVKHYSSGMYVRLAFAVAAHLEPEVLLVDEVLAVGDAAFQRKCLGKMSSVAKEGRTVLLVSHQLNQIRRLCERCIWLDNGKIGKIGNTNEVVNAYELSFASWSMDMANNRDDSKASARFIKWDILEPHHEQKNFLSCGLDPVAVRFFLKVNATVTRAHYSIALFDMENQLIWATLADCPDLSEGLRELILRLPSLPVKPGPYYWSVSISDANNLLDSWQCVPEMVVVSKPLTHRLDSWQGTLNLPWELEVR